MVELSFAIDGVGADRCAASPSLLFKLRVAGESPGVKVENLLLQCQIRIEAARRAYAPEERERLVELFGATHSWKDTMQSLLWAHVTVQAPGFADQRIVELSVPCSFDFNVAATKYFYGVEGGDAPLAFLFSGTVFYRDCDGLLQMDLISWSKEANYRLPARIWQELMDLYYPNTTWLRIDREVFGELYRYKRNKGLTGWDETLRALIARQREETMP